MAASSSARASTCSDCPADPAATRDASSTRFSLGAGLGFASDGLGLGGGLGGSLGYGSSYGLTSITGTTPFGTSLLELALSRRLRLFAGISGQYGKPLHPSRGSTGSSVSTASIFADDGKRWAVGGALGLRWVLNPGGVVEISPALQVGIHGAAVDHVASNVKTDGDGVVQADRSELKSRGVDGRVGLVLERVLLANLFLRFEAYFARAGYDHHESHTQLALGGREHAKQDAVGATFGFAPSLQLRLVF
ncbi:MAG: hypothetical protein JWN48_4040 [Myxococcaceae bacterium]|nr:hypothetical protein [Myxococcaceae bacterium]